MKFKPHNLQIIKLLGLSLVILSVLVVIFLGQSGLGKKQPPAPEPIPGLTPTSQPSQVSERTQKLVDRFPVERETGRGVVSLRGDQVNIWGLLAEVKEESLVVEVQGETLEIFLTPSTGFSARPKGLQETPQELMAETTTIAKQDLTVGQEIEIVASLVKENKFEAMIISVLRPD